MTTNEVKKQAYKLGLQDARQGRVYRHSVDPGCWLRNYLKDYERGWEAGREVNDGAKRS